MPSNTIFIDQWKQEQLDLASRVRVQPLSPLPRFVAGADCAFSSDKVTIFAVAVVYDRQEQQVIEIARERQALTVPYIPGYLSFREGPAILAAIEKLKQPFGVICFDGQGVAHPRRCGIASHLGVQFDFPTVGMAKSVLCGEFVEPNKTAGSTSPLVHKGETIGWSMRTRPGVRPIFLSVGHRIDLPTARDLAMACVTKFRIPEPTRQADIEVAKFKASE